MEYLSLCMLPVIEVCANDTVQICNFIWTQHPYDIITKSNN